MTPRLKNSKKWTAFPPDLTTQIGNSFQLQFKKESKRGSFKVEGRIFPAEILLRVGYLEKGRLKQSNLEISVDFTSKDDVVSKIHLCVDALGSLFFDYFEALNPAEANSDEILDGNLDETSNDETLEKDLLDPTLSPGLDLPAAWKAFPFLNETVYLQYSTVNSDLEAEADRLLGLQANSLLQEVTEDEDEDADTDTDTEDLEEPSELDDGDDGGREFEPGSESADEAELKLDPTPKMFGPGRKKNKLH